MNADKMSKILKDNLKIDTRLKELYSILYNVNYKPYFQRNYVWDEDKATYFIESLLLGTEIPPLILFSNDKENQVIDGRQRYETIERFLNDQFSLKYGGLKLLKSFSGKYYKDLEEKIKIKLNETKIRIIQFSIVNRENVSDLEEDYIKKEIFRRYNSGIFVLHKIEIQRAEYISDYLTKKLYEKMSEDIGFFNKSRELFLKKRYKNKPLRDIKNFLIAEARKNIILTKVPLENYAKSNMRNEVISRSYYFYKDIFSTENFLEYYYSILEILWRVKEKLQNKNNKLANSTLFYESLYWCLTILNEKKIIINNDNELEIFVNTILNIRQNSKLWKNINCNIRDIEKIFEPVDYHYMDKFLNRYKILMNYFEEKYSVDFKLNYFNTLKLKEVMQHKRKEIKEFNNYNINKSAPISMSIIDILKKIKNKRFIIRPEYQRSEVCNLKLSSYLLESVMLGIKIPPIYVYKRKDSISEVIDGQQRLLTMLGFLGEDYFSEEQIYENSNKCNFKLRGLKILNELNGKSIKNIPEDYRKKILEFQFEVIEIEAEKNIEFNNIDLFLRLNTKPYPIHINSFEMWNGYGDKEIIVKIKELVRKNSKKIFKKNDKRMKVEELITVLIYLDYKEREGISPYRLIDIYKKDNKVTARIRSKEEITKIMDNTSENIKREIFKSIVNIEDFIEKIWIMSEKNSEKILELFFKVSNENGKTDQNFYLLWLILRKIKKEEIIKNQKEIFKVIQKIFKQSKDISNITIEKFIANLKRIHEEEYRDLLLQFI